jgi:hypothetical protein
VRRKPYRRRELRRRGGGAGGDVSATAGSALDVARRTAAGTGPLSIGQKYLYPNAAIKPPMIGPTQ